MIFSVAFLQSSHSFSLRGLLTNAYKIIEFGALQTFHSGICKLLKECTLANQESYGLCKCLQKVIHEYRPPRIIGTCILRAVRLVPAEVS